MALKQGFVTIGTDPYVYQENTTNNDVSASMGIDSAGTGLWNLNVSTSAGAKPGVGFQPMSVDPVTGVILFTPLGGGYVRVDGPLDVTAGVTYAGDILTLNDAASAAANSVILEKDRAGGVITSADALGQIYFKGYDGSAYVTGASITSTSSGTIAANRVAANLVFATHPDSASGLTPTTRMTIASTGAVTIAAPDSGVGLTVSGGGCAVTGLVSATTTLSAGTSASVGTSLLVGTTITNTAGNIIMTAGSLKAGNVAADGTSSQVDFLKSRAGTVITSGDVLGAITFQGVGTGSAYTTGASITCTSSGTIAADRVASNMVFATHPDSASGATPTTRMTIASTGAVTIANPDSGVGLTVSGGGATITAGDATVTAGEVVVTNGDINIGNTDVGVTAPLVNFKKSRTGAVITSGDDLGEIAFQGYDGTSYFTSARIRADSSGTIAAGRIASTMEFYTAPDSVTASTLRMSIAPTGAVTVATPDSGVGLTVSGGGITATAGNVTVSNGDVVLSTAATGITLEGGLRIISRATTPNGVVTAPKGSLCLVANGSGVNDRMFINTDSGTTWTAVVTVA